MINNTIEVEIQFLGNEICGRQHLPNLNASTYRPHFIVPPDKMMLGVEFLNGPSIIQANHSYRMTVCLIYTPLVAYSALVVGARFDIVEGSKIVGHGIVIQVE